MSPLGLTVSAQALKTSGGTKSDDGITSQPGCALHTTSLLQPCIYPCFLLRCRPLVAAYASCCPDPSSRPSCISCYPKSTTRVMVFQPSAASPRLHSITKGEEARRKGEAECRPRVLPMTANAGRWITARDYNSMLAPHIAISHGALICTLVLRHHSWIGVVSDGMAHDSSGTQPLDSTQLKITLRYWNPVPPLYI